MLISSKNIHTATPRIEFDQICGHSMAQSIWHIKLLIEGAFLFSVHWLPLGEPNTMISHVITPASYFSTFL